MGAYIKLTVFFILLMMGFGVWFLFVAAPVYEPGREYAPVEARTGESAPETIETRIEQPVPPVTPLPAAAGVETADSDDTPAPAPPVLNLTPPEDVFDEQYILADEPEEILLPDLFAPGKPGKRSKVKGRLMLDEETERSYLDSIEGVEIQIERKLR